MAAKYMARHGIGFRSATLKWSRLKCLVFGHEEWRDANGAWFCMRCLKSRDLELTWVRDRFDTDEVRQATERALAVAVRLRSAQLASRKSSSRPASRPGTTDDKP